MRHLNTTIVPAALLTLASSTTHAGLIAVPGDAPTIQIAINLASDGDEIVVSAGTYFESLDLLGKAVTLRSAAGPEDTVIDALGQFDSAVHCTQGEGPDTIIQGFTIRRGTAEGATPEDRGGGLYANLSSPTVIDCIFSDNLAIYGGALYANGGAISLHECSFLSNESENGGGALYLNNVDAIVTASSFELNVASGERGGAIRSNTGSLTIEDCDFVDNASPNFGGAVSVQSGTIATVRRSWFDGNFCGDGGELGRGGAIYGGAPMTVTDSVFVGNSVTNWGGALYAATPMYVANCTLIDNSAGGGAGGAYSASSGGTSTLVNLIARGNGDSPISGPNSTTFSNVEGGHPGVGNIDLEPLFADAAGDDFRLLPGSPCLDAGDTTELDGAYPVDFDGQPRAVNDADATDTGEPLLNLVIDMGAFERQLDDGGPACPADFNGDGVVNGSDLGVLLGSWGPCS